MSDARSDVQSDVSRVVVGVDGTDASRDALHWAVDYASRTGAQVQAVTAWQWPVSMVTDLPTPAGFDPMDEARQVLERIIANELGESPAVTVTASAYCGSASAILLDVAQGAELLVVGSRGHGGFAGLLLGSTSEHCVRHAGCPVVVVRHHEAGKMG
jgi:nucleotide-binding universal stress UspA family protein